MMRDDGGLLAADLIDRVCARSGVARSVIVQRWGTGSSLIADMVSERAIAVPGYPDAAQFSGVDREGVLSALVRSIGRGLGDDELARSAVSQALVSPVARTLWFDFVSESLEKWAEILAQAGNEPYSAVEQESAAHAVSIVAGQCYSRMVLGESAAQLTDDQIVLLATMVVDRGGLR